MFPHIRYCLPVWGGGGVGERRRVQKGINFGARIVTGIGRRDHISPALAELGWPTVEEMVMNCDLSAMRRPIHSPHAPSCCAAGSCPARQCPPASLAPPQPASCSYRVCALNSRGTAFHFAPHALGTANCENDDAMCSAIYRAGQQRLQGVADPRLAGPPLRPPAVARRRPMSPSSRPAATDRWPCGTS